MILEFVFEVDIIWTHFLHILDNVNGNPSFCDKMLPVK